jgi:SAM-dependent methyltransferase
VSTNEGYSYVGNELELFIHASNWKKYWADRIRPFISGSVLDVGAGLGATFDYLHESAADWTCLEPDPALCTKLVARVAGHTRLPRVRCGTLADLEAGERFHTILYIDVLEHIEHDRDQLEAAARHLAPGGSLIVLSPALPFLYSAFDASVGHFRRYTRQTLEQLSPETLTVKSWFFLDGVGVLASLFARLAKRKAPTPRQIATWDKTIVPVSRITDSLTASWFGRTIVMVWSKR